MKQFKIKMLASLVILSTLIIAPRLVFAGSLEPPAAPAPTMKTLDEIEPRIPIPGSDSLSGPFTINESGSYYLTGNRRAYTTAIVVEADNVTIDLSGYSLIGTDTAHTYGIYMFGRKNVEICNGTIRNFEVGIQDISMEGRGCRIISVRLNSNTISGIRLWSAGNLINSCTVTDNGKSATENVYGIYAGSDSEVTGNIVCRNGESASGQEADVFGIAASWNCTINGNTVTDNGRYAQCTVEAVSTSSRCTITNNMITGNGHDCHGDYVYGIRAWYDCTITGNKVCNNGYLAESDDVYGILAGFSSAIKDNVVNKNGIGATCQYIKGIDASYSCLVSGNTAYDNGSSSTCTVGIYGITASWGSMVKDNVAGKNGNSAKDNASIYGIQALTDCTVTGNVSRDNGYSTAATYIYGIQALTGCSVTGNTSNANGSSATGTVYGISISSYCLVDQNTAYDNNGTNMVTGTNCQIGMNLAP